MKLLYYTKINFANSGNSGIIKKVFSQVKALRKSNIACDLFYFEDNSCTLEKADGQKITWRFENKWQRIWFQYFNFTKKFNFAEYQAVYIRHFFLHPLALSMLKNWKKINKSLQIVMEIASYPYHGQARKDNLKEQLTYRLDSRLTSQLKKYVDVILTFSPFEKIFEIPTLRTANGIDTEGVEVCDSKKLDNELHILGLANVQHWHGFDRVVTGIKDYYSSNYEKEVFFHIVGNGDEIPFLKKMVETNGLTKNVIFHGAKYGSELGEFFNLCQIAVSSLGMHRIGVANGETSNLKVREYCARGIPFINGYLDRDIPSEFPYIFQVNADESPIDFEKLILFFQNLIILHPNYPIELNSFAKENLTWEAKLKVLVDYLEK